MRRTLLTVLALACTLVSWTQQIYEPEGLNIPGSWTSGDQNDWSSNPPDNSTHAAFRSASISPAGEVTKISTGTVRWQTIFNVANSGADATPGTKKFKFTSGGGNPWANQWGDVTVTLNNLQSYNFGGGPGDNYITLTDGKWYTMNWRDNNYTNTSAIFMETSSQPVTISSVSQSPIAGSVEATNDVTVTVTVSATPSAEERIYVRYAVNGNWAGSTNALVSFTGNVGTATIPMQAEASTVAYYVYSTTVTNPSSADADMVTIRYNNNGGSNYGYTVNTALPAVDVTFRVDMSQVGGSAYVSGSFNSWAQQAMVDQGAGVWTYTTAINQGAAIEYKFRQGANYEGNLSAPCGNGNNRTHTVGNSNEVLNLVCYGSCDACPPPPTTVDVTFRVNMSQQTVSGNGVHLAGNFQGWNPGTTLMTDANSDGIYEVTLPIVENTNIAYKFINGNDWGFEESVSGPCTFENNRTYAVGSSNVSLNVVCYASCDNCPVGIPTHPVTFRVNMANAVPSSNGVHLAGNFGNAGYANWVPDAILMTDADGDLVYEVTLNLNENTFYDFKYVNGNTWDDAETAGDLAGCEYLGNRTTYVAAVGKTLPRVCFKSCSNCTYAVSNDNPTHNSPSLNTASYVYPNNFIVQGTTTGASTSPYTGLRDVWYSFTAISNGVRVIVGSSAIDSRVFLFRGSSPQTPLDTEDLTAGIGTEILNFGGLVAGQRYYIAVAAVGVADGAFNMIIQQLRQPTCIAPSSLSLCSSYQASAAGAASTTFSFTDGNNNTTSATAASIISLGNPALQLRYNQSYQVNLTANYVLTNGLGANENISVPGAAPCNIAIGAHPAIEVKSNQRCSSGASLFRSSYLQGVTVGASNICGVTGYRVEFTPVADCAGSGAVELETFTKGINGTSATISLSYAFNQIPLPGHSAIGYWRVRWAPIFASGDGSFGNPQIIAVNGTAIPNAPAIAEEEFSMASIAENMSATIYPNPNNGEMMNLNMTGTDAKDVFVRVMDGMGRVVYNNRYTAAGSLNTVVSFGQPLAAGLYMVEFKAGNEVIIQRMMVSK